MHIEWRLLLIIEKEECCAYSQEKRQTMLGKLLPCLVTTNLWQNPGIFNEIFHFFIQNGLISFDDEFDVRSFFLDISKTFDKV